MTAVKYVDMLRDKFVPWDANRKNVRCFFSAEYSISYSGNSGPFFFYENTKVLHGHPKSDLIHIENIRVSGA